MKKIAFLWLLIALLVLVSCGGDPAVTSAQSEDTTKAPAVTTVVAEETTTAPVTTDLVVTTKAPETTIAPETSVVPSDGGTDILNGDPENRAINPAWKGSDAIAFENHHSVLDFHVALVMLMTDSENAIYEDLFMTLDGEEGSDATSFTSSKW